MSENEFDNSRRAFNRLKESVRAGNLNHAYIFEVGFHEDQLLLANSFLKLFLCQSGGCNSCLECRKIDNGNHPDVHYVFSSKNSIKDEQIENLQNMLKSKPFGDVNIGIIFDADKLTLRAQNRLLKTLEEPLGKSVLVFLALNTENLIQTIRSRCQIYRFEDSSFADNEAFLTAEKIENYLYDGVPFVHLKNEAEKIAKDKNKALDFLDCLEEIYAKNITSGSIRYSREKLELCIREIEEARILIMKNMNGAYVLKKMMLKIGG